MGITEQNNRFFSGLLTDMFLYNLPAFILKCVLTVKLLDDCIHLPTSTFIFDNSHIFKEHFIVAGHYTE